MVADYVVNQIYLLGSMCLGRNYVSMRLIEEAYPYEYLVAIIVGDNPPEVLRAYINTSTHDDIVTPVCIENVVTVPWVRCLLESLLYLTRLTTETNLHATMLPNNNN